MAGADQLEQQDQTEEDEAQAQADFDSGSLMDDARPLTAKKPDEAEKTEADAGAVTTEAQQIRAPKYVRVTAEAFERLEAAAKRSEDHEKQFSKVFGTVGDMRKIVTSLQSQTPRGTALEIPKEAFTAMEKDYPELASHVRSALEATIKGMTGTGSASAEVNAEDFDRRVESRLIRLQSEALEDAYPDWRSIVGAVDTTQGQKADPNNAFRKWLGTKDQTYQAKVNGTNSADVISRAIRAFKKESATAQSPSAGNTRATARADLIRENVRPRGDGGHAKGPNADDEFEAGFKVG